MTGRFGGAGEQTRPFKTQRYPYASCADQQAKAPVRHSVVIIGAGPVGLALAIDLAQSDVPVVVLDENEDVSSGSRAICMSKRTLEIMDRLGCARPMTQKGVVWNKGKVFFKDHLAYEFDLLPEGGHQYPAFINLQQYYCEHYLLERLCVLKTEGKPVDIRGHNKVTALAPEDKHVRLTVETPDGAYVLEADWLVACDGAHSQTRNMLGLDFSGRVFKDNFLIVDVVMKADFPTERWFWFDPTFNPGQSALLHKQPDGVWRIDLQLGWDIDREAEKRPENAIPRLKRMLGEDVAFDLEWVSIYTFRCCRLEKFRHGRVFFAGDSAHQVSPFGARGANSGVQDTDNLAWKLKLVLDGVTGEALLDSYDAERIPAADENILNSTRSTDFISPKSGISRVFRDAVLDLAENYAFARSLVNSGRLSTPAIYDQSPLNGHDDAALPPRTRPGAPAVDAPLEQGWLLAKVGGGFILMGIGVNVPHAISAHGLEIRGICIAKASITSQIRERYLGRAPGAVYLVRPDQHVAARWRNFDETAVRLALRTALALGNGS
ncbi:FAD-dependent oxidoreductase [Roseibium sp. RKSG952]|uniref:FAD-dependent oxidoreductase n=1 Tax=Roseibium sp. RKSG952 TaxID=2529384 RepID=UPI0012BCC1F9|nr:FAD-dependent oxidoreductase [Roseibium sp. RKSG952]MTH96597.1 FAD-dependent oxidoreductase [Roseibium sp. RKSG952]